MGKTAENQSDSAIVKVAPDGTTADDVNVLIAKHVMRRHPDGYQLIFKPQETGRYGGEWVAVVRASREGVSALEMSEHRRSIEKDLRELEGLDDVSLLPLIPPDYDPSEPELLEPDEQGPHL